MKNSSMIVVAVIVLALGGLGVYAYMNQSKFTSQSDTAMMGEDKGTEDSMMNTDETMMKEDETAMPKASATSTDESMMKKEDTMMKDETSSSRYVPYSKAVLDSSVNKRRVLFFYANWCPTCKPANEDFQANAASIPADVMLIRVNYNDSDTDQEEKDLAKKYGVTYQHTFIQIDANGAVVSRWNGGQFKDLLAHLK